MKFFIKLICLCLFSTHVFAHSFKGIILEEESKQPLVGATVRIINTNFATSTDIFGRFQFDNLQTGSFTVEISYIGFETLQQSIEIKENETNVVNFSLKTSALQLKDIIISGGDKNKVNVISAVDIELRPVQSSQDILRMVPGLFTAQHAGGGKAEQIFLRGFDIDHGTDIHLTVDGMPVNMVSHAHGQGYSDFHFIIPELVGQVNFEKGTYHAYKGNFATAGFVEFNTQNVLDKSMLKVEGGQFGTYRLVGAIDLLGKKAKENRQSAYIATEYLATQNYFDSPQNFNRINIVGKYHQYLDDNKILTATISTFRSQWDASGQVPERAIADGTISRWGAIDNTEGGKTDRTNLNLQLKHILPDGSYLSNQVFFINYNFELYSNFTFFLNDPINGDQIRQKESRNIFGYNGSYNRENQLGNMRLNTEIGASIRYDNIKDNELSESIGRQFTKNRLAFGDIDETNTAIYVNETLFISTKLSLNAGLRFDYFKFEYIDLLNPIYARRFEEKTRVSPKLNLNYDVNEKVRIFAKSGLGFHSNDTRVVIAQNGKEILPKALGYEAGLILKPIQNLFINIAAWRLDLEQEFVYVGDAGIVEAGGKTQRQGIDFGLRYQLTDWLFIDADVNLTEAKALNVPSEENKIPLAPTFTSIGGLSFRFPSGINGSLRYRYLGDRAANETNSLTAEGYFLLDAVLNYTRPKYQLGISIVNLTNSEWKEAQFDTESRLQNEIDPVSEIHFTPGSPFFLKASLVYFF